LPEKKGNISTVMQSLGKTSFGHPKVRKEEFKVEQLQRRISWMVGRTGSLFAMEKPKYLSSLTDHVKDCVV